MSLICTRSRNLQLKPSMLGLLETVPAISAQEILVADPSAQDGVYYITVNNVTFPVYCDMTARGGGWILVVAQFDNNPLANWNKGRQANYDPTLATRKSFCLNENEIPPHTETAFGKSLIPDYVCAAPFVYTTGDIPKTAVTDPQTGLGYYIHRSASSFYPGHDPGLPLSSYSLWNDTLTCDQIMPDYAYSWSFSPNYGGVRAGYAMLGYAGHVMSDFAWTVWVR